MSINEHNYEAWFLDYSEGTLSPEKVAELLRFVAAHPDLREELEEFEIIALPTEKKSFPNKAALKKEESDSTLGWITLENCEERFIEASEGLLSSDQTKTVYAFLAAHPEQQTAFDAYLQVRIAPDLNLGYSDKLALKKVDVSALTAEELLLIGSAEGSLTFEEEKQLATLLQNNPQAQSELAAYQNITLEAPAIFFADKATLKQKERKGILIPMWSYTAAAAVVLLLLWWRFGAGSEQAPTNLADTEPNGIPALQIDEKIAPETPESTPDILFASEEETNPEQHKPRLNENFIVPVRQNVAVQPKDSAPNDLQPLPDTQVAFEKQEVPEEEKTPIVPIIDENDAVAMVETPTKEFLSPSQIISKKVKATLVGEEKAEDEKITFAEVASNLVGKVDQVTSTELSYADNSSEDRANWSIQIGKFGLSRSKAKKP